jgi:hypothetical protein
MTYNKPEVVNVMEAQPAIQHSSVKTFPMYTDADPNLGPTAVSPAYEADE